MPLLQRQGSAPWPPRPCASYQSARPHAFGCVVCPPRCGQQLATPRPACALCAPSPVSFLLSYVPATRARFPRAADRAESTHREQHGPVPAPLREAHTQARGVAHARGLLPMLRLGSVAPLQVLWAEGATALFRSPFTQSVKPAPAGSTFSGKLQKGLCLTHRPICSFVGCPWVLGGSSGGRSRHLGLGRRVQSPWPAPCSPELTTVLVLKTLSLYSPLNRHVEHHLPEGRSVVST